MVKAGTEADIKETVEEEKEEDTVVVTLTILQEEEGATGEARKGREAVARIVEDTMTSVVTTITRQSTVKATGHLAVLLIAMEAPDRV